MKNGNKPTLLLLGKTPDHTKALPNAAPDSESDLCVCVHIHTHAENRLDEYY